MEANTRQVGGDHYKQEGALQHWDIIARNNIGYLEGNATKYISRWRKKGGVQDLEKALHYVEKIIELADNTTYRPAGQAYVSDLRPFLVANNCTAVEARCIELLCSYWGREDLGVVCTLITGMIADARAA